MKKALILTVFSLLFLLSGNVLAQKGWKLGALAIPQISHLANADDSDLPPEQYERLVVAGVAAGVQGGYNFTDFVGFRINLLYSLEGGQYQRTAGLSEPTNFVTRLGYLKVPVMLGLNTNPNNKIAFSLYAGAEAAFLTNAWTYNTNKDYDPGFPERVVQVPGTRDLYENVVLNLVGQAGIDIKAGYNTTVNLMARVGFGLVDVEDKEATLTVYENGGFSDENYWEFVGGAARNSNTTGLTLGLMVGFVHNFGQ